VPRGYGSYTEIDHGVQEARDEYVGVVVAVHLIHFASAASKSDSVMWCVRPILIANRSHSRKTLAGHRSHGVMKIVMRPISH